MNNLRTSNFITLPIIIGLILSTLINGITLLLGGSERITQFINFYNRQNVTEFPSYLSAMLLLFAVSFVVAGVFLVIALAKGEFIPQRKANFLQWGIFSAIVGVTLYGFSVRMISNHQAAANLYFYFGLLYFFLWYVENNASQRNSVLEKIKLLPIFAILIYTMGQPGLQKILNATEVMPRYVNMFKDSVLASMPGGIEPMIYFLGIAETIVPILLIVALLRKEFLPNMTKTYFGWGLLVSAFTFVILSFGLGVILNLPGATNLVFYAIFTLGFYAYAMKI